MMVLIVNRTHPLGTCRQSATHPPLVIDHRRSRIRTFSRPRGRSVAWVLDPQYSVQLAITIEHDDPAYIDARGGYALLSYLRGAPDRVQRRRLAIQRAFDLYSAAEVAWTRCRC